MPTTPPISTHPDPTPEEILTTTPTTSPTIARLSIRHDAILNFLIANPMMKMGDVARYFNVTPTWLSIIMNSDAFRERLAARQDAIFSSVTVPLRARVEGLAHRALDRMADSIEHVDDHSELRETADMLLHRLGYAPRTGAAAAPTTATQINISMSDPALLAEARRLMEQKRPSLPTAPETSANTPTTPENS
jgi:hypothetical protein